MQIRSILVFLPLVLLLGASIATADSGVVRAGSVAVDTMGTITGRLRLGSAGGPAGYANLIVVGTRRGTQSAEDGTFLITDVPLGPRTLRILTVSSGPRMISLQVGRGENALGDIVIDGPKVTPLTIGNLAEVAPTELKARIRPAQKVFHVGDAPKFEVRIHNRSKSTALLVRSVDGSDFRKSPQVKIAIAGPMDGFVIQPYVGCGNTNGVGEEDFVEVPPGGEFDPYATGWVGANLRHGHFVKPGRYTATIRYVTTETDPRLWIEGPCGDCEAPASYRELLARVTAVDLTATTRFQVKP